MSHRHSRILDQIGDTALLAKCPRHQPAQPFVANADRHLKPPQEMARLFKGYEPALARTREIVDACRFSLDELSYPAAIIWARSSDTLAARSFRSKSPSADVTISSASCTIAACTGDMAFENVWVAL